MHFWFESDYAFVSLIVNFKPIEPDFENNEILLPHATQKQICVIMSTAVFE